MSKHVRVSFTVPEQFSADLDLISQFTGISRSALVSELLGDTLSGLTEAFEGEFSGSGEKIANRQLRQRGRSKKEISDMLSAMRVLLGKDSAAHEVH